MVTMPTYERHSDEWYGRCAELATQRGLVGDGMAQLVDVDTDGAADEWRALDAAIRAESMEPDNRWRMALALWSVASGSTDTGHDVLLSVAWDVMSRQPYPVLTCSCPAGRYGKPCSHVGCVLLSDERSPAA